MDSWNLYLTSQQEAKRCSCQFPLAPRPALQDNKAHHTTKNHHTVGPRSVHFEALFHGSIRMTCSVRTFLCIYCILVPSCAMWCMSREYKTIDQQLYKLESNNCFLTQIDRSWAQWGKCSNRPQHWSRHRKQLLLSCWKDLPERGQSLNTVCQYFWNHQKCQRNPFKSNAQPLAELLGCHEILKLQLHNKIGEHLCYTKFRLSLSNVPMYPIAIFWFFCWINPIRSILEKCASTRRLPSHGALWGSLSPQSVESSSPYLEPGHCGWAKAYQKEGYQGLSVCLSAYFFVFLYCVWTDLGTSCRPIVRGWVHI